jgi:hypothetical protein
MYVSEVYNTLAVQATWDDRAVNQDSEMVGKSIAEYRRITLITANVGPLKSVAPFKMKLVADAKTATTLAPLTV